MITSFFRHFIQLKRFHFALAGAGGVFLFFATALVAQAITLTPPRLELDGDPGTTISSEIKITNEGNDSRTYYTQVENFEAKDESGSPSFTQAREGLATWVEVAPTVTLRAGEQRTIPFTIQIPRNAEPGGYFASIFIRTTPPPANGGEVSIGARLGSLLLVRVNGDIREGVDILEFGSKDKKRIYTSLPVELYYRFQNTGADRVKPQGSIMIKNVVGLTAKVLNANRSEGSVLPRSIRRFDSVWATSGGGQEDPALQASAAPVLGFFEAAKSQLGNFAFGMYTANLDIVYGENNNTATATFRFFVIPWQLLSIVLVGLLVLLIVFRFILKRYTRYIISKHTQGR